MQAPDGFFDAFRIWWVKSILVFNKVRRSVFVKNSYVTLTETFLNENSEQLLICNHTLNNFFINYE